MSGLPTIDNQNINFSRKYIFKNNKILFETVLKNKHQNIEKHNSVELLPLRKSTIKELLQSNGFNKIEFYSSFEKKEFTANSSPLIVAASTI